MNHYYIYLHCDPLSGEVFYVGRGSTQRAWMTHRVHRGNGEHTKKIEALLEQGFLPCDWVRIDQRWLSIEQAKEAEKKTIEDLRTKGQPLCNAEFGSWSTVLNNDALEEAHRLREKGLSFKDIAKSLQVSTMTIHRALSGKTKAYGRQTSKN